MNRKVNIIEDLNGKKVVLINDVFFRGKKNIDWDMVEQYLKRFVGESFVISETADIVYIGADLPDEYAHSEYTHILRGANAKAKANAIQGVPEIVEIASEKRYTENYKIKHRKDAKYGWYRYESRFALPIFDGEGEINHFNVFRIIMVIRHDKDGKMYLYDIIDIKKETSNLFQSQDLTQ